MYRLGKDGLKILKLLHIICASCWFGGALSLFFLYFLKQGQSDQSIVHGINLSIHHIDLMVIIIPGGAIGSFLTGLLYSLFSNWGFFKHRWITIKWIITVSAILSGTFLLGPWETALMELSGDSATNIFQNYTYLNTQKLHFSLGSVQVIALLFTLYISVFRPWKKKG